MRAWRPGSGLLIRVLLCGSVQVTLLPWVSATVDIIISEVPGDRDSAHLAQSGDCVPGTSPHTTLLLEVPKAPGGLRAWELAVPTTPPAAPSTTDLSMPFHCLHVTDR